MGRRSPCFCPAARRAAWPVARATTTGRGERDELSADRHPAGGAHRPVHGCRLPDRRPDRRADRARGRRRHELLRLLEFRPHGAVDARRPGGRRALGARSLSAWCATSPARAGLPMPRVYPHGQSAAERVRDRPQSGELGGRGHHRPAQHAQPRRGRGRGRARARPHQEPRHADHDDHRDDRRRDLDAGAVRHVLQRRQPTTTTASASSARSPW